MKKPTASDILLALFGLNRAGQILWGAVFVLGIAGFVYWTMLPGMRFTDADEQLFRAARHGDRAGIESAIQAGAALDRPSPVDGKTAIFRAAILGHADAVRLLIDRGADPKARSGDNKTPLDIVRDARAEEKNPDGQRALDAVADVLTRAERPAP